MGAKRQATSELNHDNWDEPEEPVERGTFRAATADQLKNRVIKKARRKVSDDNTDSETKSVFGGFGGFSKGAAPTASTSGFNFLTKLSSTSTTPLGKDDEVSTFGTNKISAENGGKSSNYYAKLKTLNQSVSEWIKTHVDKNPICILSPIFKDYEKYLSEIEEEEKENNTKTSSSVAPSASSEPSTTATASKVSATVTSITPFTSFKFSTAPAAVKETVTSAVSSTTASTSFSFGLNSSNASQVSNASTNAAFTSASTLPTTGIFGNISKKTPETQKSNGFSFGLKSDNKPAAAAGFNFDKPVATISDKTPIMGGFSFSGSSTPFSFGNIQPPPAASTSSTKDDEEDEEDLPPKVEFKQVVEDDAIYSKKCKVFVKKNNNFADCGVGTLYLKPVKDSKKTQLLVRADTNLGNILVNLILNSALPVQRMGKNNVMLVCLPTPDVEKPTSLLLRVKTGEEADELLEKIEESKKFN